MDRILIKSHAEVEIDPSLSIVQTDKTNDAMEVNVEHSGLCILCFFGIILL